MGKTKGIRVLSCLSVAVLLLLMPLSASENKPQYLTFESGGENHSYYLFIPEKAAKGPAPLLVFLRGSGDDGKSLIGPWLSMAMSEGIILLAPDASKVPAWRFLQMPPFFHDLLQTVRGSHPEIDHRRLYLFGHSADAIQGLDLALLESEDFAAVAIQARTGDISVGPMRRSVPMSRTIPLMIMGGTGDLFARSQGGVGNTGGIFSNGGYTTRPQMPQPPLDKDNSSSKNKETWAFLKDKKLENK